VKAVAVGLVLSLALVLHQALMIGRICWCSVCQVVSSVTVCAIVGDGDGVSCLVGFSCSGRRSYVMWSCCHCNCSLCFSGGDSFNR